MSAELMRLSAEPISVLSFSGSIRVRAPKERSGIGLWDEGDNAEHRWQVMDGSKNNARIMALSVGLRGEELFS